jgi:hypothetical protein
MLFTVLLLTLVLVAMPMLKLEFRRRVSRHHRPQPQELWLQDRTELLYVEGVDYAGVHLLALDPSRGQVIRWTDSWPTWSERLRRRVVWYTGRSGILAPSEWISCHRDALTMT